MTQKVIQRQDLMLERWLLEIKPARWADGQQEKGKWHIDIMEKNPYGAGRKGMASAVLIGPHLKAGRKKGTYLPAKDSAAFAAKVFDLLGMDSITFISCQS